MGFQIAVAVVLLVLVVYVWRQQRALDAALDVARRQRQRIEQLELRVDRLETNENPPEISDGFSLRLD